MPICVAFKAGQLCMAVDQYVAVFHPLRHFSIMMRACPWLFATVWLMWGVQIISSLLLHFLDLETFAENTLGSASTVRLFPECRWQINLANVYIIAFEIQLEFLLPHRACSST